MDNQRLLTIPTFEIMLEHHPVMREVIREMDRCGEPYIRESYYFSVLHRYIADIQPEKKTAITVAFNTDNLRSSHLLVDKEEYKGESVLIFDRSVIGLFRLFDHSLFQDLTDVALKTHLGGIRFLLSELDEKDFIYHDSDINYKEYVDQLLHRLSDILNSIRLNLVKMQRINDSLTQASEQAVKSQDRAQFLAHQQKAITQVSHLLSRHILPTRQFLDEKTVLKDGPNLFGCLQTLRQRFEAHQDTQRAHAMLRYEITFNSFHREISKVSRSVDQFLARSKKRMHQFNAIEAAFDELRGALDDTKVNLKRRIVDGGFARNNGAFLGLQRYERPKLLRISSSPAYLNNVVSDIEARIEDSKLLRNYDLSLLSSSHDQSTELRLARARLIQKIVEQMPLREYQDLTQALHQRLQPKIDNYSVVDLLEGINFMLQGGQKPHGFSFKVVNQKSRLIQNDTAYFYRRIRTERQNP